MTTEDFSKMFIGIYKNAYHATLKQLEMSQRRCIELSNELLSTRQEYNNLLRLIMEYFNFEEQS
jgi:hypothetical protein